MGRGKGGGEGEGVILHHNLHCPLYWCVGGVCIGCASADS